jgi:tripartite-type tricarboxylate transporter receptor subunit TctC
VTRRHLLATGVAAAALPILGSRAKAQAGWPNKPIRVIVPYPVGGQTDMIARAYGEYLSRQLGQPVIVENKSGAGGIVGATEVKRAAPDGYTLMLSIGSALINNRVLFKEIPYDPDKDFVLISAITTQGIPLVASDKSGATNLKEFIAFAKKADKISVGTYGAGTTAHMAIAELNKQYGTNMEPVHYRGEAPMWADLASQSIDGAIGSYVAALPVLQGGRGKIVGAVGQPIKTMRDQGATSKAFTIRGFSGLLSAPAGTPDAIVKKLSELMVAAGSDEKTQTALSAFAIDKPVGFEETQKIYKEEAPITVELLRSLNLTPQ